LILVRTPSFATPGYFAAFLLLTGFALSLGSWWALIPAGFGSLVLVVRTIWEDRTLHAELPGYAAYARRVRFRLFPACGNWWAANHVPPALSPRISRTKLIVIGSVGARGMIRKATGLSGLPSLFAHRSGSRVGSAPFPLFPCVILAPVFGGAYSWPTTLFWSNPRQFFQALMYF
jgi:hypothetical protein